MIKKRASLCDVGELALGVKLFFTLGKKGRVGVY